jgi:hypothetical protein
MCGLQEYMQFVTHRDTHTDIDKPTQSGSHRQKDMDTYRQTQTYSNRHRHTLIDIDRHTKTRRDRHTDTNTQTTDIQIDTER